MMIRTRQEKDDILLNLLIEEYGFNISSQDLDETRLDREDSDISVIFHNRLEDNRLEED